MLVAAFDGERWIEDQLRSIVSQTGVDVSVVVGDDHSTDDTPAKVAALALHLPIKLVRREVGSGSAAQNFFALMRENDAADVDFVAFSDQDDVWLEGKLARATAALTASRAVGYSSAVTAFWESGREVVMEQVGEPTPADFLFEGAGQGCTFVLTAAFYRRLRQFVLDHPHLVARLHYHDWTTYALARMWNEHWCFDTLPTVRYRQHENNDTGARSSSSGVRRRLRLIWNGWYSEQIGEIAKLGSIAVPTHPVIAKWNALQARPRGLARNLAVTKFCLRKGRRKKFDTAVLLVAGLLGWI